MVGCVVIYGDFGDDHVEVVIASINFIAGVNLWTLSIRKEVLRIIGLIVDSDKAKIRRPTMTNKVRGVESDTYGVPNDFNYQCYFIAVDVF